jgi:putative two-component system response regulator
MDSLFDSGGTVLVVDDSPDTLQILNELLRDRYKVRVAANGEQALKLAALEPKPDAVLLDIMMPGINGYEVCGRLKADPATADIPVIFISAKSQIEEGELGFELGGADYITKPFMPSVVRARVGTHVALKRALDFIRKQAGRDLV